MYLCSIKLSPAVRELQYIKTMNIIRNTESDSELLIRIAEGWAGKQSPTFDELSVSILQTHHEQGGQVPVSHGVGR